MRRALQFTLCLALLYFQPGRAAAQGQSPPDVESRFDLNTYQLPSTPDDGFVLEHAAVLKSLQFGFAGLAQVDDDPLTWQRENDDGDHVETAVEMERLILLHLGAAIGFFDYTQLAVHMPFFLERGTSNSRGGAGDMRLVPKAAVRFAVGEGEIGLAALVPLALPTGDEKRLMGEGGVSVAPTFAADAKVGKLRIVLNTGYDWREKEERDILRGPEMTIGLGAEYDIMSSPGNLRALIEADMATQTGDFFGRASSPMSLLGGIRYRFERGFGLGASMGAGVTPGVGNPDFRALIAVDFVYQKIEEKEPEATDEAGDSDGDGIRDFEDKCVDNAEDFDRYEDDDGCPEDDNDGDGLIDGKDDCPNEPENKNGMDDDDGCPDFDGDGDGIPNHRDACPKEAEDQDGFIDDDGCPEDDNDLDGISDADDECPLHPESPNKYKDNDGCPDYFRIEDDRVVFKRSIRFMRKTAELHDNAYDIIDEWTMTIISNPAWKEVHITVHTSGRGRDDVKQKLSEDRALAILRLIVAGGVLPERLIATGKGNSEPLASADTPEGRKQNERVEISIRKGAAE